MADLAKGLYEHATRTISGDDCDGHEKVAQSTARNPTGRVGRGLLQFPLEELSITMAPLSVGFVVSSMKCAEIRASCTRLFRERGVLLSDSSTDSLLRPKILKNNE